MTDKSIEELKEQTQKGTRTDSVIDGDDTADPLADRIVEKLDEIENGDQVKTVAVRDAPIAALLTAVADDDDELESLIGALADELGRDPEDISRSEALRLAVRLGIETAAPEYLEEARDAAAERAKRNL